MITRDTVTLKSTVFFIIVIAAITLYLAMFNYLNATSNTRITQRDINDSDIYLDRIQGRLRNQQMKDSLAGGTGISQVGGLSEKIFETLDKDFIQNLTNSIEKLDRMSDILQELLKVPQQHSVQIGNSECDHKNCASAHAQPNHVTKSHAGLRQSLLTLFTSWTFNSAMFTTYNNTVNNWASFYPSVTCIVFTNDSRIEKAVLPKTWAVRRVYEHGSDGLPVLKYMYKHALETFESDFYGYVNSDILFTENLMETLIMLKYAFPVDSKPIIITGQRWNVIGVASNETYPKTNLNKLVSERGALFSTWAADYFIATKSFPWEDIIDIVIGSLGLDTWVIIHSRKAQRLIIDATKTILAIHQSMDENPYRSHKRNASEYNKNLIYSKYGQQLWEPGRLECIEYFTDIENDQVVIHKRDNFDALCAL